MARTCKDEHRTDGWNWCRRLDRQARPAGHDRIAFEADLMLDREDND